MYEEMNPVISIIVPVYNVQPYIEECLKSVLCYNDRDAVEIIIINDGSTDASGTICKEMIRKYADKRIMYVEQTNQGLAAARNRGMSVAKGKYIAFLDSDDAWREDAVSCLLSEVKQFPESDVIFFDAYIENNMHYQVEGNRYNRSGKVPRSVISGKEYFCEYYLNPYIVSACMAIYKTSLLRDRGILFSEGRYHEDIAFSYKVVMCADKVKYAGETLYKRRYRENSIMTSQITKKHVLDRIEAYRDILKFTDSIKLETQRLCNAWCAYMIQGMNYLNNSIQEADMGKGEMCDILNMVMKVYRTIPDAYKGYTYYEGLSRLAWMMNFNKNMPLDEQSDHVQIEKKRKEYKMMKLREIPLGDPEAVVAIYGSGNHTKKLLSFYEQYIQEVKATYFYVDSVKKTEKNAVESKGVVNIHDLRTCCPELTKLFISSYLNHNAMKQQCLEEGYSQKSIIDFYEEEKIALF